MGWRKEARGQERVDGSAAARRTKVCPSAPYLCLLISDLTLPPFSPDAGARAGRTQENSRGQPKDTGQGNGYCRPWQCGLSAVAMLSRPQDAAARYERYVLPRIFIFYYL